MAKPELKSKNNLKMRSYFFAIEIVKFVVNFPKEKSFWVIGDQLLRAGTSIGANIVEAQAASSRRDFTNFYNIALKSANETKYWICLLRDSNLLAKNKTEKILSEADEISKMLGASLLTLRGKK